MFSVIDNVKPEAIDAEVECPMQYPEPAEAPDGIGATPSDEPNWSADDALGLIDYGRRAEGHQSDDDEDVDFAFDEFDDEDADDDDFDDDDFDDDDDDDFDDDEEEDDESEH